MTKIYVWSRKKLYATSGAAILLLAAVVFAVKPTVEAFEQIDKQVEERVIHMVTGEFKTTTKDGKVIEAYRWDPGTIVVKEGDQVTLNIWGVNGNEHPFYIEGMDVKGVVTKGNETTVSFHASQTGIYRLICQTHADRAHHGPMIGYIVVEPR
ncbi:cupredoxin domain-containing protein [Marinicrinis sediminis]|uniref:Cupredoxin domain-containing protein n=1 Tax=Marinicrinis sediminis TaxID=1652465 RepID=A0ABW5RDR0_9BACL